MHNKEIIKKSSHGQEIFFTTFQLGVSVIGLQLAITWHQLLASKLAKIVLPYGLSI